MNCAICGAATRPHFQKHGYTIVECSHCGHQAADLALVADHVAQVYGDHYFAGGGDGYPDYLAEADLLIAHGKRYGALLAQHMAPGRVLDIGAAAGFLLQGLQQAGWSGVGLEPNARMVAHGREHFGLEMVVGELEQYGGNKPTEQFDLVSMIQVIGHFHDLPCALAQAARLTKTGGFWLIESWDRSSWPARMLGEQWHEYSPPSVLHWFTASELIELAATHGFQVVAQGQPQKWINAAHAKSLLRYKLTAAPGYRFLDHLMTFIPDTLALPYPAFDLCWLLLQKCNNDNP